MIMNDLENKRMYKIVIYIFAMFTILNYSIYYYISTIRLSVLINVIWQLLLLLLYIYSLLHIPNRLKLNLLVFSSIYSSCVLIFLVINYSINPFNIINFIFLLILDPIMLVAYFIFSLSNNINNKNISLPIFFICFENLMIFISIISLIFWMLLSVHLIKSNMSIISKWGVLKEIPGCFWVDFIAQGQGQHFLGVSNIIRNTGIFPEAPIYSYFLCIALFIELFLKRDKVFNIKTLILLVTIFSTTSTTGILIALPAIFLKVMLQFKGSPILAIVCLFSPVLIYILWFLFVNKLHTSGNNVSTFNHRISDVFACIKAWKNHIVFGNGIFNTRSIENYESQTFIQTSNYEGFINSVGDASGLMRSLAYGGIIYSLIYIIPTTIFSCKSLKSLLFAIFMFSLFVFTIVSDSYIYIIIISYFWASFLFNYKNRCINKEGNYY